MDSIASADVLFRSHPNPMWIYDPATLRILAVNDAAVHAYGYDRDAFLALKITDFRPREEIDRLLKIVAEPRHGWRASGVWKHLRRNGELFYAEIASHDIEYDGRPAVVVSAADVTDRVTSEAAARQAERRYRELIENLNEIVWAIDTAGLVTYLSPNAEAHGYRFDALVRHPFTGIVHPDDLPGVLEALAAARSGSPARWEFRALDGNGIIHHVRASFRATFENGHHTGFQGVLADISEQRRAEEQLRAAQRLEAVGRLAGGIAHDFNNLLVVINGYAELAMMRLQPGDALYEDLEEILQAGERAASLTQQLLAFSRKQLLHPALVNLNEVVNGMGSMLKRVIGEDITFTLGLEPDLPPVFIDAAQLEHAVMNLAVNARDAMPDGGTLRITTSRQVSGGVPAVVLSIEDSGHGMDEATRARIFEPFFTTKPVGKGTGLGLPMVYGFVKQSGGSLHVRTAPGHGSAFSIVLNAHQAGAEERKTTPPGRGIQRGGERILVVEDEDQVRELLGRQLGASGYDVRLAATPAEAIEVLEDPRQGVDLLLTDIMMPGVRGTELARQAAMLRPDLAVLYMTGYPNTSSDADLVASPPEHTIWKPFTTAELTGAIRAELARRDNQSR
jgi:hypothetical protein